MVVATLATGIGSGLAALERIALGALGTGIGLSLGVEDILLGCTEGVVDFLDGSIDGSEVGALVSLFQLGNGSFNRGLLVGRNLIAEF